MFDFNGQEKQTAVGGGVIPAKSMVKLRMKIRQPGTKQGCQIHPLVRTFKTGLVGLDCEFEVVSGSHEKSRIWENIFLPPGMQNPSLKLTKGQEGICNRGGSFFMAILEAARGIHPADGSPAAMEARKADFTDFQAIEFPAMVGIEKPQAGDEYLNNNIMRIITTDKEEYPHLMQGGDIITDLPLPEIPGGSAQTGQTQNGYTPPNQGQGQNNQGENQAQGNPGGTYQPPNNQGQNNQGQGNGPNWAQQLG